MERINVSEGFRVMKTNCHFKMEFSAKIDMRKAYEAMEAAVMAIADTDGYYPLWLQDLGDCCENDCFDIDSTLGCEEFYSYVPAMYKAVAEAFPSSEFEAYAWYDDLKCYCVDEFEGIFKGNRLVITETFADDDHGYFCPECGYQVATCGDIEDRFESDEITCDDCDEVIKVSDLRYVPPTVTVTEYHLS
jgi:hypothetical protein